MEAVGTMGVRITMGKKREKEGRESERFGEEFDERAHPFRLLPFLEALNDQHGI